MKRLLIDIGNTRMKGCIAENSKLGKVHSMNYSKSAFTNDYSDFLNEFNSFKGTSLFHSNSVFDFESVYISLLDSQYRARILLVTEGYSPHFINTKIPLPIKIDYTPTLGSDRICSAVGAHRKFKDKKNILIIDFGTATTFNIVSNGVFKGGMISTGIRTSADALMNKTSLPEVSLVQKINLINNDTENAIISGLVFQQVLFVQKAIEEYKNLFKDLFIVATGGGITLIKKHNIGIDKFLPNLVLEGLNHIAIYNETIRKK